MLNKKNKNFLIILAIIFLLKFMFATFIIIFHCDSIFVTDTYSYIAPLKDMTEKFTFSVNSTPEVLRTPGYPIFLAPFYFFGGNDKLPFSIYFQIIFSFISAYLIYNIVMLSDKDIKNKDKVAKIAFVVMLIDPAFFSSELLLMTESLFTVVLILGIFFLVKFFDSNKTLYFFFAVITIAISSYIRPIAALLNYFLLTILFIYFLYKKDTKKLPLIAIGIVINFSIIFVWEKRNEQFVGERTFSVISSENLNLRIIPSILAKAGNDNWEEVDNRIAENDSASLQNPAQIKIFNIILSYPIETAYVILKGIFVNMFDPGTGNFINLLELREKKSGIIYKFFDMPLNKFIIYLVTKEHYLFIAIIVGLFWMIFFWGCFFRGIITNYRNFTIIHVILLSIIMYFLVLSAGPYAVSRLRIPIIPLLSIFVALGLQRKFTNFDSDN